MEDILDQLYHGKIYPLEQFFPNSQEYTRMENGYYQRSNAFRQMLEKQIPPLHDEFQQLMDEKRTVTSIEIEESFLSGFCLGVRLTAAAYERN